MKLLSDNSTKMLKYMQNKAKYKDSFLLSSSGNLPNNINRDSALHQLEKEGYCYNIEKMGRNGFKCNFNNYLAEEYFQNEPKLIKERNKKMFNKIPNICEELLYNLITHQENLNEYVASLYLESNDNYSLELNQKFGVLKENNLITLKWADNIAYNVSLTLNGKHYFEFKAEAEEENNKRNLQNINISGNQVNIATNNSAITATQNNGINSDELNKLIQNIRNNIPEELSSEDKADVNESLDIIQEELLSNEPNTKVIKSQFNVFKRIDVGVKFLSSCASLLTFADKFFPFISKVATWIQSLI